MGPSASSLAESSGVKWGDVFSIALQRMRTEGAIRDDRPLIRIDFQDEAAQAPFQFDPVQGRLHRRDCAIVPKHSRSALFARWTMWDGEQPLACSHCRPSPLALQPDHQQDITLDIFFGVISILDQFGTVLQERGKEYRSSKEGQELEKKLQGLYGNLDRKQKETLGVMLETMDQMVRFLKEAEGHLHEETNRVNGNGSFQSKSNFSTNGHKPEATMSTNGKRKSLKKTHSKSRQGRPRKISTEND